MVSPQTGQGGSLAVGLYRELLAAIRADHLPAGTRLPSSRAAAAALGLSRNTVNTAYDLLRAEGAVDIRPGATPRVRALSSLQSTKVVPLAPIAARVNLSPRGQALADNPRALAHLAREGLMAPGAPDAALFPAAEWGMALRRAARRTHGDAFGYGEYHGLSALRRVLAARLLADRGVRATPEQIIVTPGTQSALAMLTQALADPGDAAMIEDPGYLGARVAFQGAGLRLVPMPVDAEGANSAAVAGNASVRLIYLTPSNHYPLGVRMSLARRIAVLGLARQHGAVVLEDDYDSEFHWHGREIAALQSQAAAGEVIYLGTAAKALMPALRLGWIVVPDELIDPMQRIQRNLGLAANLHAQAALAEMMQSGRYRAHLHRIARVSEGRGMQMAAILRAGLGARISVRNPDGGLQLAIRFAEMGHEARCQAALVAAGFAPARLSAYCLGGQIEGLVSGFADATPPRAARFVAVLAGAMGVR